MLHKKNSQRSLQKNRFEIASKVFDLHGQLNMPFTGRKIKPRPLQISVKPPA